VTPYDKIITMNVQSLLKTRRDEILAIAARNGARNVRVFGSVARGENKPDSDIDFLINLEAGRSLLDMARLLRELQSLLGAKVDVVTEAGIVQGFFCKSGLSPRKQRATL
jgi:predicted nucleotidyltransferase